MVSLRGQYSTHYVGSSTMRPLHPETGSTVVARAPGVSSVTTEKDITSKGGAVVTVTTTTTTVRTSTLNAQSSNAATSSSSTGLTHAATGATAGNVSSTTITTLQSANGLSSVTTATVDNGAKRTSTTTFNKDALLDATTVTTKTDANMTRPVRRSRNFVNVRESSAATPQETSSAAGAVVSTSPPSTSSVAKKKNGGALASITSTARTTPAENSIRSIPTSGTTTDRETSAGTATLNRSKSHNLAITPVSSRNGNAATLETLDRSKGHNSAITPVSSRNGNAATLETSTTPTASIASSDGSNGSVTSAKNTTASNSATGSLSTSTAASSNTNSTTLSSRGFRATSSSRSSLLSSSKSLESWFTSTFRDHETQLVVGANSSDVTAGVLRQVCNGLPTLITRSNIQMPNGGCPDELTALNASCTCLTGYSATASSWAFHVTTESRNSTTDMTMRALTQSSSDELAISTIRPIWVSSSLKTLEIEGTDDFPAKITFMDESLDVSNSSLPLVRSVSNSTQISTLSLTKLDLNAVAAAKSDFVPITVTNLTLRNCNISTLGSSFTRTWGRLQYLDLSSNNLGTEFVGGAPLKELNMSHNALTVFPIRSLDASGLEALYIQGNDIKDFNVSQDQFEQIQSLRTFKADKSSSLSTCQGGAWQSAHGTAFCVLSVSTAAAPDPSPSSGSTSGGDGGGLGLLSYWLVAGAIIVFFLLLLVIWQRRRHSRESDISSIVSPESIETATPKYDVNHAFGDALNNDNVTAAAVGTASAVVAAQAYPGYGRSHGNSVDSEDATDMSVTLATNKALASCRLDYSELILGRCVSRGGFGLVFVGSYRGRQVAVKKIRNERDVGREQVEQFVREISLISGLNHPRIVEFIGACWTIPAELSAVTELMERGDLRDVTRRFKRRGYRLSWENHKANIALHIAEALTYLHGLTPTVIHRDLKAKNVMLNADMEAKLSDFGIARERSSYDGSEHMTVGIGTSFWIAPEVLLGHDYDERADIYSFGVVLSEIDTDDYPYWNTQYPAQGKAQENEILRLVARGAKRPIFSDDCPPTILELAARCLRTDPEERPSAFEIVLYLQQFVHDRSSSASFSSMVRAETACNGTNAAVTARENTIVNHRSTAQAIQQVREMTSSSAAVAYASGKRLKKTTTTTTTAKTASSSVTTISRPTAVKALSPAHELMVSSRQVTHSVACAEPPTHGKKIRRNCQGNTSSISEYTTTAIRRSIGNVRSSQSYVSARPTSPARLPANHQVELNTLQPHQLSSSSGKEAAADGIDCQR